MRNEIRQALRDYQNLLGEEALSNQLIFSNPSTFSNQPAIDTKQPEASSSSPSTKAPSNAATTPIQILLSIALGEINAYSRIKNSTSRNMTTDVHNLAKELHKKYFIEESAAKAAIESIAELLGYTAPTDNEEPSTGIRPVTQPILINDSKNISNTNASDCKPTPIAQPSAYSIGSTVLFGDYTWRILDSEAGKLLLISEEILEQRGFHPCYAGVTWEHSELRKYLNGDFLNLFAQADQELILETKLKNPDNIWYGINGGNDTMDKIFILNLEEADRYFGNSEDYLKKRRKKFDSGKWVFDDKGWILSNAHDQNRVAKLSSGLASFWWLRSPGYSDCTVAYVSTTGNIPPNGDRVCIGRGGVRPALWVKIIQ